MTSGELFVFMAMVAGFALSPGPNMMLYLTHTFEYGRNAGWATVAGITSAFLFHVTAIVFGLTALLVSMPGALAILRYAGIAYLLYLAWKNLKTLRWNEVEGGHEKKPYQHFYVKGLIGNLLNPGTVFLYFSVIPQFIHPERGNILLQNIELCGLQMLGSTVTNCTIVFLAGFATQRFFANENRQRWLRYTMSALIAGFAIKMLFWKN
jgi:threonine/homoserine/homoserine lactone efflux protein